MFTNDSIRQVKEVDILRVVEHFIKLDKHHKACCPFHNEKSPSFHVSGRKGIYKCFGCGAGGDAISFVMNYRKVEFEDAVEIIAQIGNVVLEKDNDPDIAARQEERKKKRERQASLREVLQDAHSKYIHFLHNPAGEKALEYLIDKRGYTLEEIKEWQLGFAPDTSRMLADAYTGDSKGSLPKAIELGLVKENDRGHYDAYRNRIIIPIHNEYGELISFGGRLLDRGDPEQDKKYPKYINGLQSPLYDKSKVLFAFDAAQKAIKRDGFAIIVEGYFDVITMHKAGAENTICLCGTALTTDMLRLLKRYEVNHVILMPDNDQLKDGKQPGIEAASRMLPELLQNDITTSIYIIPDAADGKKQDPDDFARQFIANQQTAAI